MRVKRGLQQHCILSPPWQYASFTLNAGCEPNISTPRDHHLIAQTLARHKHIFLGPVTQCSLFNKPIDQGRIPYILPYTPIPVRDTLSAACFILCKPTPIWEHQHHISVAGRSAAVQFLNAGTTPPNRKVLQLPALTAELPDGNQNDSKAP